MTPEQEKRLADLLLEVFELPEAKRRAYLEAASGDDAVLLEEALACIALEEDLGDFLEEPAFEAMVEGGADPAAHDPPGAGPTDEGRTVAVRRRGGRKRRENTALATPTKSALGGAEGAPARSRLGAFRITGHVGAGGMGEVYVGEDSRLGRRVAIKTLPRGLARHQAQWLERFEREARALAALNHPNIVTIHSIEEDEGVRFLTMELVEGKTLKEVIPEGGLPWDETLRIAVELSSGLAAAHERGVVHRDLKPTNLMITTEGQAKILDFGIAKIASSDESALTHDGMVLGTVPYMAPEQIQGRKTDARSDLFSFGVVLYQMATGLHPFAARGDVERMQAILKAEPEPVHAWREDLPKELNRIVRRCLEKDPSARYPSAVELREDLLRLQEKEITAKILESHSELPPAALRQERRSRAGWIAAVTILLVAALFLIVARAPPTAPDAGVDAAASEPRRTSLAVLFFHNLSGDPKLDWLRTGIAELLTTDLAQAPRLDVLGTEEVYRLARDTAEALPAERLRKVAEQSGASTVVRGSYALLGDVLRLSYTLEEPRTGEVLHAGSFEGRGEASLFGLVDQLSAAVLGRLEVARPELGPATVEDATTTSIAAWHAYAEAQALYLEQSKPEAAIAKLEEALRIDPDFALASVNIAKMHQSLGRNTLAQKYSQKAFELADRLPLNTRFHAEAGYYGTRWATTGRAIETYNLALKVYPGMDSWRNNLARRYAFFERYQEAIEEFGKLIDAGVSFWGNYYGAANAHAALGDFETGYRLLADFAEQHPRNGLLQYALAWHLTEWGRYDQATEAFARVAELRAGTPGLHYGLWRLRTLREEWPAAEREARRLLELDDAFAQWRGHVSLARNSLYHGRSAEALDFFGAAVAASTGADRALARCFLAELHLVRDEPAPALREARRAQEEGREHWPELRGYFLAALAEEASGRPAAADALVEILRERWRRQPNAVEERQLHHLAGLLALGRGKLDEGLRELERAAALLPAVGIEFSWHVFPDHVPLWTALGEAELRAGRPRAALPWLLRAAASGAERLEQPVAYVTGIYLEGLARRRLGETAEAERRFERFRSYWQNGDLKRPVLPEPPDRPRGPSAGPAAGAGADSGS